MQTYTQMKDSGVAWLGEIPAEWQMLRIGQLFSQRNEKVSDKDFEPLSVTKKGIVPQLEDAAKTDNGDNRKKVLKGDYVINSRSDRKGSSGISKLDGSVSLINTVLAEGKLYPRFAHHLLRSYPFQEEFYRWGQGIVADLWSTNYQRMKSIQLPVPDYETQERIANYLDEETTLIDDLIAKQQRLLTLLEEKRRATITHAVTRGLDPSVEFKETNIPWLSQVPAHWTIRKLNALTRLVVGSTPSTANSAAFDGDQIWVTISDMNRKNISKSKQMLTKQAVEDKNMELVPKGSLLFSFKLSVGKVGYADIDLYTNEAIAAFLPNDLVEADFLYYAAQTYFINEANTNIYGAALFNQELLRRVRVAFPNMQEQRLIVEFLENEEAKIARMNKAILNQIDLLKERRTSLISHAVTGKIKV